MPAERIARLERGLQIDRRAGCQVPECRQRERLARYVGRERAITQLDCRQATALHADAVTDIDPGGVESIEGDQQPSVSAARLATDHPADVLNDTREHSPTLLLDTAMRHCSRPAQPQSRRLRRSGRRLDDHEAGGILQLLQLAHLRPAAAPAARAVSAPCRRSAHRPALAQQRPGEPGPGLHPQLVDLAPAEAVQHVGQAQAGRAAQRVTGLRQQPLPRLRAAAGELGAPRYRDSASFSSVIREQ